MTDEKLAVYYCHKCALCHECSYIGTLDFCSEYFFVEEPTEEELDEYIENKREEFRKYFYDYLEKFYD